MTYDLALAVHFALLAAQIWLWWATMRVGQPPRRNEEGDI